MENESDCSVRAEKIEKKENKKYCMTKKDPRDNYITIGTDFVQRARNSLSLNEDKAVQYILSKVQPTDPPGKVYYFDCEEFYEICSIKRESYTELKAMIKNIADRSIWYHAPNGTDKLLRWFNVVNILDGKLIPDIDPEYANSRYVAITFHPDMFPFILRLAEQQKENGEYLMSYQLKNVAGMRHVYSARLYRLLKSYQNRGTWIFEYGTGTDRDIQIMIATTDTSRQKAKAVVAIPKSWKSFTFFQRDVLEPAKEEINRYTDIVFDYTPSKEDLHHVRHRKYVAVAFTISPKSAYEKRKTQELLDQEHSAASTQKSGQMELADFFEDFAKERELKIKADDEIIESEKREQAKYPICAEYFAQYYTAEESDRLVEAALNVLPGGKVKLDNQEVWALDYIDSYNKMVQATPNLTKTTPFRRLMDMVRKDYQGIADMPSQWDIVK